MTDREGFPVTITTPRVQFRLELLRSTRGFERLLQGFQRIRAVTYVARAGNVLDLFEKLGYQDVEVVLGESFTDVRGSLDPAVLGRLCERMEDGSLRIFVPRKTIHSKLYILERPDAIRVLHGSRNFYPTGSWDSMAVFDLTPDDPVAKQFLLHYEEHLEGSSLFLGNLLERLREGPERRQEIIEAWLQQDQSAEDAVPVILQQAIHQAVANPMAEFLTIELPKDARGRKDLERVLEPILPPDYGDQVIVRTREYLGLVEKTVGLPLMVVDLDQLQVRLVLGGVVRNRTSPLPADPLEVDRALAHLERYVLTAESEAASSWDLAAQKAGMYEAILYILASPFFHEQMKVRRARFGLVDRRGPLFLMVYGRSSNGKTTLLQFALKLVAGEAVSPLPGRDFKETTLDGARNLGTVFPLVFDDVPSITDRRFENIIKSYWEKRWVETNPVPQLIFSSNVPSLRDWARTRVKKVAFPVYFQPDPARKEELHRLLLEENRLFEWFSFLYLQRLRDHPEAPSDDLAVAREVMRAMYAFAERELPKEFPVQPVEQLYSTARLEWHDLVYKIQKAELAHEGTRIRVEFKQDMQRDEVSYYESLIPLGINKDRKGNTVLIYSPQAFLSWLHEGADSKVSITSPARKRPGILSRLFTWRPGKGKN